MYLFFSCCSTPAAVSSPPPTDPPADAGYTFSLTGSDLANSGAGIYTSSTQSITVGSYSSIAFSWTVDDFAVLIPAGSSVTATTGGGQITVTIPAHSVILGANLSSFSGLPMVISDGTHSATISTGTSAAAAVALLVAAGFNIVGSGASISLSTLSGWGMVSSGTLAFKLVLVPSGNGSINITSATLA